MTENKPVLPPEFEDPDLPILSDEVWKRGEIRHGDRLIRAATGTLTKAGRPPIGEVSKQQITLRLDRDIIAGFRASGPGWQARINAALRQALGR